MSNSLFVKNCLMQISLSSTGVVIFGEKVSLVYVIDSVCFLFFAKTRTRRQIFGKERLKNIQNLSFDIFWNGRHAILLLLYFA